MEKVRFGIVGTGRISDWVLAGAVEDPRFEAVAVCSRKEETAQLFARKHGIRLCFTDVEAMAACPEVDAVYIGTPNHTHADIAVRCLAKGKPVLCEKPFASSAFEARQMVQAAREQGLLLMEAMISTLNPNFLKAKEMLSQIGPLRSYTSHFCQFSSKYAKLQEAIAEGNPSKLAPVFNPLCSGGSLLDIGIYTIYPMVVLLGKPERIDSCLQTVGVPSGDPRFACVDVQGTAQFSYPGLSASVRFSKVADSFLPTEIAGEGGNLLLDKMHICRKLTFVPHGAPQSGRGEDMPGEDITCPPFKDEYTAEFTHFIDLFLAGEKESPVNSLDASVAVMEILDEIRQQAGVRYPSDRF